jgi:hypothetical protein
LGWFVTVGVATVVVPQFVTYVAKYRDLPRTGDQRELSA